MQSIDLLQNDVKVLGCGGSKSQLAGTSSLQISKNIVIDAGNIIRSLGEEASNIEHIFLTHSHLDHIIDIAFLSERYFETRTKALKIYAQKETLKALKDHFFNNTIWPDFTKVNLLEKESASVEFIEIKINKIYEFEDVKIKAIPVHHTVPTCAYVVEKKFFSLIYAPDTYICDSIWEEINDNKKIDSLFIDVSFDSDKNELAFLSKHLTPDLLLKEIKKLKRDIKIYAIHIKDAYKEKISRQIKSDEHLNSKISFIKDGAFLKKGVLKKKKDNEQLRILTALAKEKELDKILEYILLEVIKDTNSEGGTVYLKEENLLKFKVVINKKLDIHDTQTQNWPAINLYNSKGSNLSNVSALCAIKNEIINIPDVYHAKGFDFDGMKKFDKANNYRSKSMLVIPMIDHENELIGVLQLINKLDPTTKKAIAFDEEDINRTLAYSAYCAIAITKNKLIEDLEKLLLSFLESISVAMDAKSSCGYGHIHRVGKLMEMISEGINDDKGVYKDKNYTHDQLTELKLAAWMHDIGKIATPESILNKSVKLETTYNRLEEISQRFQSAILSLKLSLAEKKIDYLNGDHTIDLKLEEEKTEKEIALLKSDLAFLAQKNLPSGFMSDADIQKVQKISQKKFSIGKKTLNLLKPDEVKNLSIRYGTLNDEERDIINRHVKISIDMLNMLVFPKKYAKIPLIAGMHHEKLNAKGYPNAIEAKDIPFEARLLAIIDIFEALTAHDRPYKRPKTLKESYDILENMVKEGDIDGDIVNFLKESKLFKKYAQKYLLKHQLVEE